MNTRIIHNQTQMSLAVTLFIQEGSHPEQLHGTINLQLTPGEVKTVSYGDLRNCFLSGMRLSALPQDYTETYYCRVLERGDAIDLWLNQSETIGVKVEDLARMDSCRPFKISH